LKSFEAYQQAVNQALETGLDRLGPIPERLREAMRYSLRAGGKRLRPVLLLAACELAGGRAEEAMDFALGLEMIHTYSLIHDDLPAMDNDDLRRGKPTSHKVFGEAMAILAGDGLLNGAAELMLGAALRREDFRGLRAAEAIMRHAGVTGMIAGQVMDVTSEGQAPDGETVSYIHSHKTADLIQAPMEAGLILGGAGEADVARGAAYGYHLGLAFQMTDDLLDVTGDAAMLGKNTGMDQEKNKMTWVALKGVEETRKDAEGEIRKALEALSGLPGDTELFRRLAEGMLARKQ